MDRYIIKDETMGKFLNSNKYKRFAPLSGSYKKGLVESKSPDMVVGALRSLFESRITIILNQILRCHNSDCEFIIKSKEDIDFKSLEDLYHRYRLFRFNEFTNSLDPVNMSFTFKNLIHAKIDLEYSKVFYKDLLPIYNVFLFRDLVEGTINGRYFTTVHNMKDPGDRLELDTWWSNNHGRSQYSYHKTLNDSNDEVLFNLSFNDDRLKEIDAENKIGLWNEFMRYADMRAE